MLERSVVFLTEYNMEQLLCQQSWEGTAWNLANMYLLSLGAEAITDDAPHLVGLSQETTCFVSPAYFSDKGVFEDFVVHEAAHVFHNCKQSRPGSREPLDKIVHLMPVRSWEYLLYSEYGHSGEYPPSANA